MSSTSAVGEQQVLDALRGVRDVEAAAMSSASAWFPALPCATAMSPSRSRSSRARSRLETLRKAAEQAVDALPGVLSVSAC